MTTPETTPAQTTTTPPETKPVEATTPPETKPVEATTPPAVSVEELTGRIGAQEAVILEVYKKELEAAPKSLQKKFATLKNPLHERLTQLRQAAQEYEEMAAQARDEFAKKIKEANPGLNIQIDLASGPVIAPQSAPQPTATPATPPTPARDKNSPVTEEFMTDVLSSPFGIKAPFKRPTK